MPEMYHVARLFQSFSRSFFTLRARSTQTAPVMPPPLTNADRARVQAYMDAMQKAMGAIPEFDLDKVRAAREAVAKAHPISKDVLQAHSEEVLARMAEPVVLNKSPFLKPEAPWGLAVYRVSYSDDAAWDRMLSELRQDIEESVVMRQDQPEISSRHELVVMDDRSQFEGAGPEKIRDHFNIWSVDELRRNWRADCEPATKDEITGSAGSANHLFRAGPRYNYCVLVDDICLESLEKMSTPVLKLVNRNWMPDSEQDEDEDEEEDDEKLDWEGGETNNEFEDVGWMYIESCDYIDVQNQLQDDNWSEMYVRPPLTRWESDFDEAPGFWRRSTSSA